MAASPVLMPFPRYPARARENPYFDLFYSHLSDAGVDVLRDDAVWSRCLAGRPGRLPDYLHYHWPGRRYTSRASALSPLRAGRFFTRLALLRRLGVQVVWTMHNEVPHEGAWSSFDIWARRRMVAMSDLILVNFASAADVLRDRFSRTERVYHVPHGSYRGHYAATVSPSDARAKLGVDAKAFVFLAFGDVRPYKNLANLIDAFRSVDAPQARLLIAGRPKTGSAVHEAARMAAADSRILLHARSIADDEVQHYFRAADVFVIGRKAFSSGTAVLALDFGLPIVGFPEHHVGEIARGHALIPIEADGHEALARAMRGALSIDHSAAGRDALASSDALAWPPIAARFAEVLRDNMPRR